MTQSILTARSNLPQSLTLKTHLPKPGSKKQPSLARRLLAGLLPILAVSAAMAGCGGGGGSSGEAATQATIEAVSPLARQGAVANASDPKPQELVRLVCINSTLTALTDNNGEFTFQNTGADLCGLQTGASGEELRGLSARGSNSLVSPLSDLGVLYIAQKSGYAGPEDFTLMLRDERFRRAVNDPQILAEAEQQVKDYYFDRYGVAITDPVFFLDDAQSSARKLIQEIRQMIQQWARQGTLKPNGLPDDFDRQQIRVLGLEAFRKDSLGLPDSKDVKNTLPEGDLLVLDKPSTGGVVIDGVLKPSVDAGADNSFSTPSTGSSGFDRPSIDKPVIGTISLGNQMHSSRPATAED